MQFLDCFDFSKRTSLYIHVPFCKSKCSYCAFYSKTCNNQEIDSYFSKLIAELKILITQMNGKPFYTAFIGGGNPGCLSLSQIEQIASLVCKNGRPIEFTIEMNPESLCYEHFSLFEKYFTRLSMGVQSLDSKALKFLGRNADYSSTLKGINLALELREKTKAQISFDLITCLPSWHDYVFDVKSVVENYKPDHLSVYALTLEEGTPLFNKKPILPNSDEQSEILEKIWSYLEDCGYEQYEVSNFALDGNYSKHNSVYWDYEQYVGLGPAAASTAFGKKGVYRIESPYSINDYVSSGLLESYKITQLSNQESLEEFVLMGLRHTKGLNLDRLKSEYGKEISDIPVGFSIVGHYLLPNITGLLTADWAASQVLNSIDS